MDKSGRAQCSGYFLHDRGVITMGFTRLNKDEVNATVFMRHTAKETGDVLTISEYSRPAGGGATIKKLSADEYMVEGTGEVRQYERKAETRDESLQSLRRTMARLRDIVNCNVTRDNTMNCLWLTLTYADRTVKGEEGAARVTHDWKTFAKRFGRYCERRGIKAPEYLYIPEPHADGVFHIHGILKWSHKRPFVPNADMAELWGHGFTKTMGMSHNNLGQYLACYLTDIPVNEMSEAELSDVKDTDIVTKEVNGKSKRFVKGGRLHYYPSGMNLIRHSRGIKMPETYDVTVAEMERLQDQGRLKYEYCFKYVDDETGFEIVVTRRIYIRGEAVPLARAA